MRPAGDFLDLLAVELIEAGIGVRLQRTGEVRQMGSRSLALAIGAVAEDHRRGLGTARRPIVPHVGP